MQMENYLPLLFYNIFEIISVVMKTKIIYIPNNFLLCCMSPSQVYKLTGLIQPMVPASDNPTCTTTTVKTRETRISAQFCPRQAVQLKRIRGKKGQPSARS